MTYPPADQPPQDPLPQQPYPQPQYPQEYQQYPPPQYPPQPYPPQYYPQPVPQVIQVQVAKKRVPTWLLVVTVGLVLLCCGGSIISYAISAANSPSSSSNGNGSGGGSGGGGGGGGGSDSQTAKLNQPVRDGKFEFTVTKVDCGRTLIGSSSFGEKAHGQFCIVSLTITNIGNESQMFNSSDVKAFNAAGQEYETNGVAAIYLDGDSHSFLEDINPGNTVKGRVVFDIPKNQKIVKLELHDSMFSDGATVTL